MSFNEYTHAHQLSIYLEMELLSHIIQYYTNLKNNKTESTLRNEEELLGNYKFQSDLPGDQTFSSV